MRPASFHFLVLLLVTNLGNCTKLKKKTIHVVKDKSKFEKNKCLISRKRTCLCVQVQNSIWAINPVRSWSFCLKMKRYEKLLTPKFHSKMSRVWLTCLIKPDLAVSTVYIMYAWAHICSVPCVWQAACGESVNIPFRSLDPPVRRPSLQPIHLKLSSIRNLRSTQSSLLFDLPFRIFIQSTHSSSQIGNSRTWRFHPSSTSVRTTVPSTTYFRPLRFSVHAIFPLTRPFHSYDPHILVIFSNSQLFKLVGLIVFPAFPSTQPFRPPVITSARPTRLPGL